LLDKCQKKLSKRGRAILRSQGKGKKKRSKKIKRQVGDTAQDERRNIKQEIKNADDLDDLFFL